MTFGLSSEGVKTLRGFHNRMLRGIFRPKKDEATSWKIKKMG
jgi:hypothetical protein